MKPALQKRSNVRSGQLFERVQFARSFRDRRRLVVKMRAAGALELGSAEKALAHSSSQSRTCVFTATSVKKARNRVYFIRCGLLIGRIFCLIPRTLREVDRFLSHIGSALVNEN